MAIQLDLFGNDTDTQAKDPIWILKNRPAPDPNSPIIVSYGGGTYRKRKHPNKTAS